MNIITITPVNGWKTGKRTQKALMFQTIVQMILQLKRFPLRMHLMMMMTMLCYEEVIERTLEMQVETDVVNNQHQGRETRIEDLDTSDLFETENDVTVLENMDQESTILNEPESGPYGNEVNVQSVEVQMNDSVAQAYKYVLTISDYLNILYLLRLQNEKKWTTVTEDRLQSLLSSTINMNKFLKCELMEITKYLNVILKGRDIELDMSSKMTKVDIVNQLSDYVGDGILRKRPEKNKPKQQKPFMN
ncbi:unnamed protein product [Mytilus edulis]|uniref:Uncharacterized protein n=1 Tax=Mytilus edulis TaxID=6550 RepID=A0A8S3RCM8_MYTED|nr:unnamed protein product [Mytilus edulis]